MAIAGVCLLLALVPSVTSAATKVKSYRAWDANGDPVVDEFTDAVGDCGTESFKSSRADAWRCFAGSLILDSVL